MTTATGDLIIGKLREMCYHPEQFQVGVKLYADWLDGQNRGAEAELVRTRNWAFSGLEPLIGRTVRAVYLDRTSDSLHFETDEGGVRAQVEGDCCSVSWFYSVTRLENLLGQRVALFVDADPDCDCEDGLGLQEYDQAYAFGIVTPKGVCTVCYRNSSNGYYGGWLESAATDEGPKGERLAGDWVHPPAEREGG